MSNRRLIIAALICLAIANVIPAFRLAGDMTFGFMASFLEFLAILFWFGEGLERGQLPASALGIIANVGFLATCFAAWMGRHRLAKRIAVVAAISAFGSVAFLATGSEDFVPYPGCVLWLATGVLLVLGTTLSKSSSSGSEQSEQLRT